MLRREKGGDRMEIEEGGGSYRNVLKKEEAWTVT